MNRLLISLIAALICCGTALAADEPDRRSTETTAQTVEREKAELFSYCRQSRDCKVVIIGPAMIDALSQGCSDIRISGFNLPDTPGSLTSVEIIEAQKTSINDYLLDRALKIFSEKNGYEVTTYTDNPKKGTLNAVLQKQLSPDKFQIVVLSRPNKKTGLTIGIFNRSTDGDK